MYTSIILALNKFHGILCLTPIETEKKIWPMLTVHCVDKFQFFFAISAFVLDSPAVEGCCRTYNPIPTTLCR